MIEVVIDSVKVSLVSQYRLVVLKERFGERYLPIWIGPFEADAITYQLQGHEVPRPLTHDLLKKVIQTMGAELKHVVVTDLRNETFYANLVLSVNGRQLEVDSRPSDAIALAVRANAKIYVADDVMDKVSIVPEEDISGRMTEEEEEKLSAFSDFIDTLDLDDLGKKTSYVCSCYMLTGIWRASKSPFFVCSV
jgi:bifunctional DNase/RNase